LTIDFGLHATGPATSWVARARPGMQIGIAGPRGSGLLSNRFEWNLLIGDETALPAIARRLEELPSHVTAIVVALVDNQTERYPLPERAGTEIRWAPRQDTGDSWLSRALSNIELPSDIGFAWVAGEAAMAHAVRRQLIDVRRFEKSCVKAAAYWRTGAVGKHEILDDSFATI
jgi:NADPH-dependent ferric siderophore reductase